MAESRRKEFFPEVTDEQWNDWKFSATGNMAVNKTAETAPEAPIEVYHAALR